jgi:hypothetical protein
MHDIVKDEDLSALAAEYVIGTLDPDERTRANVLLEVDEGFRALVRAWERRLGELHLMVEPVEPNGRIWERVRGRLGLRAAEAPPPFTPVPPPFVPPPPPPFGAPAAEPVRAAAAEPKFEPRFEPKFEPRLESRVESMLESKFESKFELPPAPQLEPAPEAPAHDEFAHEELVHEEPMPEEPTPEQRLAALIREADKFSVTADPTATATAVEPAAIIAEPEGDAAAGSQADAVPGSQADAAAMTEEEALLEEAADAIAAKSVESVEPAETDQAGKLAPEQVLTKVEPWPTGAPRRDKMLTPADLARLTFRTQERRLETWRAAMLFMSVVALGLGSLIAAWRFVPERLPMRLQPTAVLGLPDLGPSERIPAQHGTQFEE